MEDDKIITITTKEVRVSELNTRDKCIYNSGWWNGYEFNKTGNNENLIISIVWLSIAIVGLLITLIIKIF